MTDLILQLEAIDPDLPAAIGVTVSAVVGTPLALFAIWWVWR